MFDFYIRTSDYVGIWKWKRKCVQTNTMTCEVYLIKIIWK